MKLSKREIILLTLLLVIGLIFVESRFIINPGIARFKDLQDKELALVNEIQTIDLNLTLAKTLEARRNENLQKIEPLAAPFLNGVTPDALLVFTHDILMKHGFSPYNYSPSPLNSELLMPEQAEVKRLTYRIKEIAIEYRNLGDEKPSPSQPATPQPTEKEQPDIVEKYSLQVTATGTFEQIKAMLDEFKSLGRSVIISNINMTPQPPPEITPTPTPAPGTVTEPQPTPIPTPAVALLNIEFFIDYYGIEKLGPTASEPLNQWTRPTQPTSTEDPYVMPMPTPVPSETTTAN